MIRWRVDYRRNSQTDEWLPLTAREYTDTQPNGTYITLAETQTREANGRLGWEKFRVRIVGEA